jgi:Kef-type K+ transport system membrane component KefB
VGAAMVATSGGITARVLGDLRVLATRAAKIILGAAAFDDILGMVLLAVVAGLASGGGLEWVHLGVLVVEACAFALFMIFVAPLLFAGSSPGLIGCPPSMLP